MPCDLADLSTNMDLIGYMLNRTAEDNVRATLTDAANSLQVCASLCVCVCVFLWLRVCTKEWMVALERWFIISS